MIGRLTSFKSGSPLLLAALLVLLCLPTGWIQWQRSEAPNVLGNAETVDPVLILLSQAPGLGMDNLFADILWLRFVQYNGDITARYKTGFQQGYAYLQAITERNPKFERAYYFANFAVAYRMSNPELAEQLLVKGIQNNPDSYRIWQYRGFLHFMYTGNYKKAADSFWQNAVLAVAREGNAKQNWANKWINTARYLYSDDPGPWLRRRVWSEIYRSTVRYDPLSARAALAQLKKYGVVLDPTTGKLKELYRVELPDAFYKKFLFGPLAPAGLESK